MAIKHQKTAIPDVSKVNCVDWNADHTGQLNHQVDLTNVGVNTHAQIDTHISLGGTAVHNDTFLLNTGDTGTNYIFDNLEIEEVLKTDEISANDANYITIDNDLMTDYWSNTPTNTFLGVDVCGAGNYSLGIVGGNTVIGWLAGYSLTSPDYNVFVGHGAGEYTTDGSFNIFIGNEAGYTTTTGEFNIMIGNGVVTPASNTDYYLNIGDTIYGSTAAGGTITINRNLDVLAKLNVKQPTAEAEAFRIETTDTPVNPVRKTYQGAVRTTDATTTTILTLPLSLGKIYQIRANVIGADPITDGSGFVGSYIFVWTVGRASVDYISHKGSVIYLYTYEDNAAWNADMTTSGNNLIVRVKGQAGITVDWTATIEVYETNYGSAL